MTDIIRREKYIKKIIPFVGKDVIKILVWQRRVWKSSIMRDLMNYIQTDKWVDTADICYINKENMSWDHIRTYTDLYEAIRWYPVILIDEIQEIPEWERAIRSLQTEWGYDIYITGSNAAMLSWELSTVLAGRYVSFEIFPLTYGEFLDFSPVPDSGGDIGWLNRGDSFARYMRYGWLPYIHRLGSDDESILSYQRDVVDTIVLRDIIMRNSIRNIVFFHRLMTYLAHEVGHIFSAKKISDYLKNEKVSLSSATIMEYLGFSTDANLLMRADRYDIKGKRIFETKHKFFFTDIGIRHALVWGYRQLDVSGVLENIVFMNMCAYGWHVQVGELDEKEIDFVCTRWDETIYLQVAYLLASDDTRDREFAPLLSIPDSHPKYVLTLDPLASWQIQGVRWQYLPEFLLALS
jgi:uncharacterized protein